MKSPSQDLKFMQKFGVVVDDDPSLDLSAMELTLDSLLEATKNYEKNNVGVLMSFGDYDRHISHTLHLSNYYTEKGIWCRGCNQSRDLDIQTRETTLFQQVSFASYFVRLNAGETVRPTLFSDIDNSIGNLKEKFICFNDNGIYVVLKAAMRSYYMKQGDYQKTVDYIVEQCKEKGYYKEL